MFCLRLQSRIKGRSSLKFHYKLKQLTKITRFMIYILIDIDKQK